ncbi:cation diffusion facilitator family transporter [Pelosinus sp. IPA-1]|uniref:cation diffusion facilitator family transporter n=1 Tax=Pelosinus sp. IPA-1 TaxID=3029569 RepID=UPI0024362694|nr:cation diffusion facilitator family transporter [Pelosinus sp. IPA-1]GMB00991.1 cation transporter [Pelosinus sp. IPA-1]
MHNHDHGHSHGMRREGNKKSLAIALVITFGIMIAEAVGGWLTNSLALLSDSGHMLSDVGSLALSLMAVWFAAKPASSSKSYGYHRFEILTALLNGLALFAIAGVIIWEAYSRFTEPPAVDSGPMMAVAFVGLVANLVSAWVLLRQGDVKGNINLRSAYLHMISDALGAVGAILAGFFMYQFGWYIADPIISVVMSLVILKGAWSVVRQSVHILMEGTPGKTEVAVLTAALTAIDGVVNVHDVHVWTVTSGYEVFSCHMLVRQGIRSSQVLSQAMPLLEQEFGIRHTTIQVVEEDTNMSCWGCRGGRCTFSAAQ